MLYFLFYFYISLNHQLIIMWPLSWSWDPLLGLSKKIQQIILNILINYVIIHIGLNMSNVSHNINTQIDLNCSISTVITVKTDQILNISINSAKIQRLPQNQKIWKSDCVVLRCLASISAPMCICCCHLNDTALQWEQLHAAHSLTRPKSMYDCSQHALTLQKGHQHSGCRTTWTDSTASNPGVRCVLCVFV